MSYISLKFNSWHILVSTSIGHVWICKRPPLMYEPNNGICSWLRWLHGLFSLLITEFLMSLGSHCFQFILLMFWGYLFFSFISYGVLPFCLISFLLLPRWRKVDWFKAWEVSEALDACDLIERYNPSWSGTTVNILSGSPQIVGTKFYLCHLWPYACTSACVCMHTLSYRFVM